MYLNKTKYYLLALARDRSAKVFETITSEKCEIRMLQKERIRCVRRIVIPTIAVLFILHSSSAYCENVDQIGFGYGQEFKHNTDISQYEIFYQHPLFYGKNLGSTWKLKSLLEFGAALIDESESDNSPTGRFSIMPQILLTPSDCINLIVGLGAGFMAGETELTDQNLGGAFLLSSKVGLKFFLGSRWTVGYTFYHQSNAGSYNHNQGLNINQLAITYQL